MVSDRMDKLRIGQILTFTLNLTLKFKVSQPKKGILIKVLCTSGSYSVILAKTNDKLLRGQSGDWRPHGQTSATTIPEGENWPRVNKRTSDDIIIGKVIAEPPCVQYRAISLQCINVLPYIGKYHLFKSYWLLLCYAGCSHSSMEV